EALPLAVVELGDAFVLAARLAVPAVAHQVEAGAAEELVGELAREHRDRVAEPEHVQDELAAEAFGVFVGHLEVRAIAGEIRTNSLVDVGEREAENPTRLEHTPKLPEHRNEIVVADHRERVNAHDVVERITFDRQPVADVATDVDAGPFLDVGVDPAGLAAFT